MGDIYAMIMDGTIGGNERRIEWTHSRPGGNGEAGATTVKFYNENNKILTSAMKCYAGMPQICRQKLTESAENH